MVADTTKTEKKLVAIEAEMRDIARQLVPLDADSWQRKQLMDKGRALVHKAQALRLSLLIGKQVTRRLKFYSKLGDAVGTLLSVRRSKCDVDFGDLGVWTLPVVNVIPADASQNWGAEY